MDSCEDQGESGISDNMSAGEHAQSWRGYHVKLDPFEGPLDLLLYLIKKSELDIYDIPIAIVTRQYLSFLNDVDHVDLDRAGDFLLMAATLMAIKAKTLLPGRDVFSEEDIDVSPEEELSLRLLEYQTFREVSRQLSSAAMNRMRIFPRGDWLVFDDEEDEEDTGTEQSINEMLKSFANLVYAMKPIESHRVNLASFTVEEKTGSIRRRLSREGRFEFLSLFRDIYIREELVVTFVALLELINMGEVRVTQRGNFKKLMITRVAGGEN